MEVSPTILSANWLAGTPTSVRVPADRIHRRRRDRFAAPAVSVVSSVSDPRSFEGHVSQQDQNGRVIVLLVAVSGLTAGVGVWGIQVDSCDDPAGSGWANSRIA